MPMWPLPTASVLMSRPTGSGTAGSWSVNVPTGGSAHTKGATWTQLVASTPIDSDFLKLRFGGHNSTGVASPALMDIAIGADGSETVILSNIDIGFHAVHHTMMFPVFIPAGTRITAKAQGARTATNIATSVILYGAMGIVGGQYTAQKWTTYGVDAANSRGTLIQPNATANQWGAWAEIATTTADHDWWNLWAAPGADTISRAVTNLIQVAVGPDTTAASACATNNTLLLTTSQLGSTSEIQIDQEVTLPTYAQVPSGTKLWARLQTNNTTDNDLYVSIYGGS